MIDHIAIILDGNGRWAKKRLLPRSLGHLQGARNIEKIVKVALEIGIKELSLYCFSTENWNRPQDEVDYLMRLPQELLDGKIEELKKSGIKINVCGRKNILNNDLQELISKVVSATAINNAMVLNICLDYGAKEEIINAINQLDDHKNCTYEDFKKNLYIQNDVDLLIRTSGEQRVSNFLLLQIAYAEFVFTKTNWPAFSKKEFLRIIKNFKKRDRRFGKI